MKQFILKNKKAIRGLAAVLLIGAVTMSFEDSPVLHQKFDLQDPVDDTIPFKKDNSTMKMKEFDKLSEELNNTLLEVGVEMKKIDFAQIQKDVELALKEIDSKNILKEVELSLKSIDLEKILADVKSSFKDINWEQKNEDVNAAMAEAKKEIEKTTVELRNVDRKSIEKALEETRSTLEKTRIEIDKIDMEKIMQNAKEGIDNAKKELKETKAMFNEMEKDGLIDPKKGFSIEFKEKDLYINGTKQSEKVTDKYRKYFKRDHFKITIEKE